MKREDVKPGARCLLPVTVSEYRTFGEGNMVRVVTEDDGAVVWVHPEALIPNNEKEENNV